MNLKVSTDLHLVGGATGYWLVSARVHSDWSTLILYMLNVLTITLVLSIPRIK